MSPEQQEDLIADIQLILEWKEKGEAIMANTARWSLMFHIGQWWADRPWRVRRGSDGS